MYELLLGETYQIIGLSDRAKLHYEQAIASAPSSPSEIITIAQNYLAAIE